VVQQKYGKWISTLDHRQRIICQRDARRSTSPTINGRDGGFMNTRFNNGTAARFSDKELADLTVAQ
jgi:hypothetical protein